MNASPQPSVVPRDRHRVDRDEPVASPPGRPSNTRTPCDAERHDDELARGRARRARMPGDRRVVGLARPAHEPDVDVGASCPANRSTRVVAEAEEVGA